MLSWSTPVVAGAIGLLVGWLSTTFFNRKQIVDELSALAGVLDKIKPVVVATTPSGPNRSPAPEASTSPDAAAHQELAAVVRLQTLRVVALVRYPPLLRLEVGLLLFCYLIGAFLFVFASYFLGQEAKVDSDDRWGMLLIISTFWIIDMLLGLILLRKWSDRARSRVEFLLHRIQIKDDRGDVVDVLSAAQVALAFLVILPMAAGGAALAFGALRYELVDLGTWPGAFLVLASITFPAILVLSVMTKRLSLERTPEQRSKDQQREKHKTEKKEEKLARKRKVEEEQQKTTKNEAEDSRPSPP